MNLEQSPTVRKIGAKVLQAHQLIYERSGGHIGHRLLGVPTLLLRTIGAKTGQKRTNALSYARDGRSYVVVASNGGAARAPGWYHNLRADPSASIQIGTGRQPVTARFLLPTDADYPRLWTVVNGYNRNRYAGYQKLTSRPIPLVVLTPA
jgi:deazaflavin-dependent oxidoreductase (nitroreductase family)